LRRAKEDRLSHERREYVFSLSYVYHNMSSLPAPHALVERIDPLHFLAGCRESQLDQALPVLSLSLDFLSLSVVLLTRATFCVVLFVFCLLIVLVRLLVQVQVIDWKDSSPK